MNICFQYFSCIIHRSGGPRKQEPRDPIQHARIAYNPATRQLIDSVALESRSAKSIVHSVKNQLQKTCWFRGLRVKSLCNRTGNQLDLAGNYDSPIRESAPRKLSFAFNQQGDSAAYGQIPYATEQGWRQNREFCEKYRETNCHNSDGSCYQSTAFAGGPDFRTA